ncbi:MAG TPA: hypothetical protein VG273_18985 [Bryobacteraceae bacterium]|jgi:hypothetical protein|nr:hypothetical protein [Bryobacteraceae bacterium]
MLKRFFAACLVSVVSFAGPARAQSSEEVQRVLDRLEKLEAESSRIQDEIQKLRSELVATGHPSTAQPTPGQPATAAAPAGPQANERLDVQESRTAELEQSKVGTSQRFPVSLTGMLLFNAYTNGHYAGASEYPATASQTRSPVSDGASLRQTVLGLKFNGPDLPGGGKASGSLFMDFFAGSSSPSNNLLRIRIATLDLAWKNTTVSVGQDKPIISPREPVSLAQVGISPLTGAGNLWDWNPQVRVEQRFALGENSGLRAQAGVYETTENYPGNLPPDYSGTLERSRPGFEGRFEFFHKGKDWRIEAAPGFHEGSTHVAGSSLQSQIFSFDWLVRPTSRIEFTGELFRGQSVAGLGALPGFTVSSAGIARPIHTDGEWAQLALFPESRLSFHIYSGEQANRVSDVPANGVIRNFIYAGNLIFKFAPNVLAALEASQARTDYLGSGLRLNNHYDLALAYLF